MSEAQVGIKILLEDGASAGLGTLKGSLGALTQNAGMLEGAWGRLSPAMQAAGLVAAGSGIVFGLFTDALVSVVHSAEDLQLSMSHIQASVEGASGVMPQLQAELIGIANNSIFTSKEVADAFVVLGQKGFTAGQILARDGELGKAVVDFAEATNSEAVPAAQVLGSTLRAFGADASESAYYADVLTAAFKNGIGSATQLQQAFSQVSGRAHDVGWGVKDTAVALDILTRSMGSGSQAGTSLQYMLASLTNPTAAVQKELSSLGIIALNDTVPAFKTLEEAYAKTGSAASKSSITFDGTITSLQGQYAAAQKMGLLHTDQTFYQWAVANGVLKDSLYDSTGKFKSLTGVVDTLGAALKGSPEQMNALIGALGGARSGKAFTVLLSNIGATDAQIKDLYARFGNTTAVETAAVQLDNLSSTFTKLGTTFVDLKALMGLSSLGPLKAWGDQLNALISGIEQTNPQLIGLGGQFLIIGTLVSGVVFAVSSFIFIMGTIGPITIAVSAVALAVVGLAVAGTAISTHWAQVQVVFQPLLDIFKGVWQILVTLSGVVKDVALNAFGHLRDAAGFIKDHWGALNPVFSGIQGWLQGINNAIRLLEPSLLAGMDKAARGLGIAAQFVYDHWYLLTPVFSAIGTALGIVRDAAMNVLGLAWEGLVIVVHKVGDAGEWVYVHWYLLTPLFHAVHAALTRVGEVIASISVGVLSGISMALHHIGDAGAWIQSSWGQVAGVVGPVGTVLGNLLPLLVPLAGAFVLLKGHTGEIVTVLLRMGPALNWVVNAVLGGGLALDTFIMTAGRFIGILVTSLPSLSALSGGLVPLIGGVIALGAPVIALGGGWLLLGALVVGMVVGVGLLAQKFDFLKIGMGLLIGVWNLVKPELIALATIIKAQVMAALDQLRPTWTMLVAEFTKDKPVLMALGTILLGIAGIFAGTLVASIIGFIRAIGGVMTMVVGIVTGIIQVFSGLIQFFGGLFRLVYDLIHGNWSKIGDDAHSMGAGIVLIFTGIWNAVKGIFVGVFQVITGFVGGFIGTIQNLFRAFGDKLVGHSIIPDMLNAIFAWFEKLPLRVGGAVSAMVTGVLGFFGHLKDQAWLSVLALGILVYRGFDLIVTTVPQKIGGMVLGIVTLFASLPSKIVSALGNLGSLLLAGGQAMIQGLISGVLSKIPDITGAAGQVAQSIANIFQHKSPPKTGPLQTDDQWMKTMMGMHTAQITASTPALVSAAHLAAQGIQSAFSSPNQLALAGAGARAGTGVGGAGGGKDIIVNNYIDGKLFESFIISGLTGQLKMNGIQRLNR